MAGDLRDELLNDPLAHDYSAMLGREVTDGRGG